MMGIPSIDLTRPSQDVEGSGDDAVRSTMFGFPVNEVVSEAFDEGTDAYEESATQIVDADQFMFDEAQNAPSSEGPKFVEKPSMRSTIAGGMPSLAALHNSQDLSEASDFEDEDEGVKTQVAAASLFQFDGAADEVSPPEPADSPKLHNRPKKHETLMGMSLDDLAPESAKNTLFSIPTHDDMGDGLSEFSEDESDVEEDIPTQAISGAVFAQEPVQDATREQNRQRLLDKLRAHNKTGDEERPTRNTMFGIPAVSPSIGSGESEAEERPPSHTPHTGVLKVAKKSSAPAEPSEASIEKSSSGVLGASSYMLNKDSSASEASAAPEKKKPLPSLNLSKSLRDKLSAATAKSSSAPASLAQTSEPEIPALTAVAPSLQALDVEDKTQVAGDDMLELALSQEAAAQTSPPSFDFDPGAGLAQESAPTVQGDSLQVDADMTREQNLADLHTQLRQSSEQKAVPRKHFSEDATRQHDLASIKEQLGEGLFALTPSEASEASEVSEHDATAVAPSLEEVQQAPRSNTGPLFATGRSTPSNEMETVEAAPLRDPIEDVPELDLLPVDPLPELDVSPVEPPPVIPVQPVAPVAPQVPVIPVQQAPAPEPVDMPMIDAVPLPVEPAYKTVTTTSSPTPPHGTQVPAKPLGGQDDGSGVGRTFQVIFGLLGAVCFVCATIFPMLGIATPVEVTLSGAVYAPIGLGILALVGALFPSNKVRLGMLILATLLGLAMFAVGLLLGLPIILSILSLVGALFALTGILFPIFARSM